MGFHKHISFSSITALVKVFQIFHDYNFSWGLLIHGIFMTLTLFQGHVCQKVKLNCFCFLTSSVT